MSVANIESEVTSTCYFLETQVLLSLNSSSTLSLSITESSILQVKVQVLSVSQQVFTKIQ